MLDEVRREAVVTHTCLCIMMHPDVDEESGYYEDRCLEPGVGPDEPFCRQCQYERHDQAPMFLAWADRTPKQMQ